jgi:hypothetical protein
VANATGEGFEGRSYTVSGEDWEQFLSEVGSRDRGGRAHRLDHGPEASVYPWTEPLHAAVQPCPPRDPPVLARLEELLAARPSEEHVHVELEEQPLEQPRLRVGEVLPELPVSLPAVQCSRNGLVERVADRKSSPSRALKWCSSMRWPVPIAAAISRRLGPRIPPACSAAAVSSRSRACGAVVLRCTVWYMYQMAQERAERLQGAAERTAHGASALVSDATRYPGWRPWSAARTNLRERPRLEGGGLSSGCGSSPPYFGGHPVSVEKIPEAEAGRRLTCTVIGGIPVRHYRPGVTLAAVDGGTAIGGPLPGTSRLRPPVRVSCARNAQSAEALADAAERQGEYVAAGQS